MVKDYYQNSPSRGHGEQRVWKQMQLTPHFSSVTLSDTPNQYHPLFPNFLEGINTLHSSECPDD